MLLILNLLPSKHERSSHEDLVVERHCITILYKVLKFRTVAGIESLLKLH